MATIKGTAGNDKLTGTAGNDVYDLSQGGNDSFKGLDGNDTVSFAAAFTAADSINGGSGTDMVKLAGSYSGAHAVTFGAATMVGVEKLILGAGFDYTLTTDNATVAANQTLVVDGSALGAGDIMAFNGAAELNGMFAITGGAANDVLTGGNKNDTFNLSKDGKDTANGGGGNDTFTFGAGFNAADKVDGGTGSNTVTLAGNYAAGVTLGAATLLNIQTLQFAAGNSYKLTTNDATVAAGGTLTVNGGALGAGDVLNFNGMHAMDGKFAFIGGAGNDALVGGTGADSFDLSKGGNDIAKGGIGNDSFKLLAAFSAADQIDGGDDSDTVVLAGDYSGGVTFGSTTMRNVEVLRLTAGHSYNLTTANATVATGASMAINASALGAGEALTFNGNAETDGHFVIAGGAANDVLTGGLLSDTFDLTHGGNDTANGGGDNDTFSLGAALTAADTLNGGAGSNTVVLDGDYSAGLTLGAATITNMNQITLTGGHSYKITTNDANVAINKTMTISYNGAVNQLIFNGTAETNGSFIIAGSHGDDTLTGGQQGDVFVFSFDGNNGIFDQLDKIDGQGGNDTLQLNGDYDATLGANTMVSVEKIQFEAGHDYALTMNDANVASGQALTVDATLLGAGDSLSFNATSETNGHFAITGGAGDDTITLGGAAVFTASTVDGGKGNDRLLIDGDYSASVTDISHAMITNIDKLSVVDGNTYRFEFAVSAFTTGTFTVDGSALTAGHTLNFDGGTASGGTLIEIGGAGVDGLIGGFASTNIFTGGGGGDNLSPGGGASTFTYLAVSDSTSVNYDHVHNFNASTDHFDMPFAVGAVDATVTTGQLDSTSFDSDLTTAMAGMGIGHAQLFTPNSGSLHGETFLVIDANGVAGYQTGADYVIELASSPDLTGFGTGNFV